MTQEQYKEAYRINAEMNCIKDEIMLIEDAKNQGSEGNIGFEIALNNIREVKFLDIQFREHIRRQIVEHLQTKLEWLQKKFEEI